jgi:uncharacterized protein (DUF1810 family)
MTIMTNADLYRTERFLEPHKAHFGKAMKELKKGKKESHWMRFLLPTASFMDAKGVEVGSDIQKFFALRSESEVRAFLAFSEDGVNLRQNYLDIVGLIWYQLSFKTTLQDMLGADYPKAISSFLLFEQIGKDMNDTDMYSLCAAVLDRSGLRPTSVSDNMAQPNQPAIRKRHWGVEAPGASTATQTRSQQPNSCNDTTGGTMVSEQTPSAVEVVEGPTTTTTTTTTTTKKIKTTGSGTLTTTITTITTTTETTETTETTRIP